MEYVTSASRVYTVAVGVIEEEIPFRVLVVAPFAVPARIVLQGKRYLFSDLGSCKVKHRPFLTEHALKADPDLIQSDSVDDRIADAVQHRQHCEVHSDNIRQGRLEKIWPHEVHRAEHAVG